jgi:hypothetical protein
MVIDWAPGSALGPKAMMVPPMVAEGIFTKAGFQFEKKFDAGGPSLRAYF